MSKLVIPDEVLKSPLSHRIVQMESIDQRVTLSLSHGQMTLVLPQMITRRDVEKLQLLVRLIELDATEESNPIPSSAAG